MFGLINEHVAEEIGAKGGSGEETEGGGRGPETVSGNAYIV